MFFEAEIKRKKYNIEVHEDKLLWRVKLEAVGEAPEMFEIAKADFIKFDDAISFIFGGKSYMLDTVPMEDGYFIYTGNSYRKIAIQNDESILHAAIKGGGNLKESGNLTAGMPGKIVRVFVKSGQRVTKGSPIVIMEAMKMENEMRAKEDAVVKEVVIKEGESVEVGATLVTFETN